MLGNGCTVDVIAHIISYCPGILSEPLEVLSMYDGMGCGRLALDKRGAHIISYYATEIDKYVIKTTMANFLDTIQLLYRSERKRIVAENRSIMWKTVTRPLSAKKPI